MRISCLPDIDILADRTWKKRPTCMFGLTSRVPADMRCLGYSARSETDRHLCRLATHIFFFAFLFWIGCAAADAVCLSGDFGLRVDRLGLRGICLVSAICLLACLLVFCCLLFASRIAAATSTTPLSRQVSIVTWKCRHR